MVEHIEETGDQLQKKTWSYLYKQHSNTLLLDSYKVETRSSKRQTYKIESLYEKIPVTVIKDKSKRISVSAVPLTGIAEIIREKFIASLAVVTELDYLHG
jgi:hypothetical protein